MGFYLLFLFNTFNSNTLTLKGHIRLEEIFSFCEQVNGIDW